jgi:hypothetical protein
MTVTDPLLWHVCGTAAGRSGACAGRRRRQGVPDIVDWAERRTMQQ